MAGTHKTIQRLAPALRPERPTFVLPALFAGVLVTAVVWVHWPVLSARAICFDDDQYLLENPLVQNPGAASLGRFFGEVLNPSIVTGYYQPLAMTSLMLDAAMGGGPENLRPFHRTSLAVHALNTLLVAVLLYVLFGRVWVAAAVGLLFGVHPLTVEPVAWIAERKTVLAMFFSLLSLIAYIRFTQSERHRAWYGAGFVFYGLALLSKPSSTPLPLAMLLLDIWPLRRLSLRAFREKAPFIVLGGISACITVLSQRRVAEAADPAAGSWIKSALVVCHNLVFYPLKVIWPVHVSGYYPYPEPLSMAQPMMLVGVAGTCLIVIACLVSLRWTRAVATGWLIFVILLSPALGVTAFTHTIAADRHAYLPLIGLLIPLAWLLKTAWETGTSASPNRYGTGVLSEPVAPPPPGRHGGRPLQGLGTQSRKRRGVRIAAGFLLIFAMALEAGLTRRHLAFWHDTETLYTHMLGFAPNAPALHLNLGIALEETGKTQEAIAHYRRSLQIKPDLAEAYTSLAGALAGQGNSPDEVINLYARALLLRPDCAQAHNNLGYFLLMQGRLEESVSHCRKAIELKRDYADAHTNLGLAMAAMGNLEGAVREHEKALAIHPRHAKAHNNLAVALARSGRTDEAIPHFRRVLELDPGSADAHNNLGLALMEMGQISAATELLREAIRLNPEYADARVNLAEALTREHRPGEAAEQYRAALRLRPDDVDVHCRLGDLLARLGQTDAARAAYLSALRFEPQNARARQGLSGLGGSAAGKAAIGSSLPGG